MIFERSRMLRNLTVGIATLGMFGVSGAIAACGGEPAYCESPSAFAGPYNGDLAVSDQDQTTWKHGVQATIIRPKGLNETGGVVTGYETNSPNPHHADWRDSHPLLFGSDSSLKEGLGIGEQNVFFRFMIRDAIGSAACGQPPDVNTGGVLPIQTAFANAWRPQW